MNKLILIPILATLFSCSNEALTDSNVFPEASNIDKCTLTWIGSGELMLIDNSKQIFVSITNDKKELVNYSGSTNGLIYQFFNK